MSIALSSGGLIAVLGPGYVDLTGVDCVMGSAYLGPATNTWTPSLQLRREAVSQASPFCPLGLSFLHPRYGYLSLCMSNRLFFCSYRQFISRPKDRGG